MTVSRHVHVLVALITFLGAATMPAFAQEEASAPSEKLRERSSLSGGLLQIAAGDDRCNDHTGLSAGGEVRTRGAWLASARVDVLTSLEMFCITPGRSTTFRGERVELITQSSLNFSPRTAVTLGRVVEFGDYAVSLAAGAGLLYVRWKSSKGGARWSRWYGGMARLGAAGMPFALEAEYGMREVPVRYLQDRSVVHEFGRFEPLLRLGFSF